MAKQVSSIRKTGAASVSPAPGAEERYRIIAEAAYYIAERRGFAPGNPEQDWYEAEAQVDRVFNASTPPRQSARSNGG